MKLSETLLAGLVKFKVRTDDNGKKTGYLPFQGCLMEGIPGTQEGDFKIAFELPLFNSPSKPTPWWREVIPEIGLPPRDQSTIFFICDVIDCLAYMRGWSEQEVGELIARIEIYLETNGMDEQGRKL